MHGSRESDVVDSDGAEALGSGYESSTEHCSSSRAKRNVGTPGGSAMSVPSAVLTGVEASEVTTSYIFTRCF